MYNENGITYTEEHSISFGDVSNNQFTAIANTWEDWHLIPSSRPSVANPNPVIKFIEIPGSDEQIDLSTYLTGGIVYGQREGSWDFQVANYFENWETIREKIVSTLHGKRLKVCLMDEPDYCYDGRFTVGQWQSGESNSSITISYQLEPNKIQIGS